MSDNRVYGFGRDLTEMQQNLDRLKGGGGDGTSGDMETRVARLESDMEHVKRSLTSLDGRVGNVQKDVGEIRVHLATVQNEMKHLPSKGYIFGVALSMLAAAGGIMAAVVRFIPHAG